MRSSIIAWTGRQSMTGQCRIAQETPGLEPWGYRSPCSRGIRTGRVLEMSQRTHPKTKNRFPDGSFWFVGWGVLLPREWLNTL